MNGHILHNKSYILNATDLIIDVIMPTVTSLNTQVVTYFLHRHVAS